MRPPRIEKVLHSHVSARSLTGDHLDAYAIKISHVDTAELTAKTDDLGGGWYRGDQLPADMSTMSLVGGGLIAGESVFTLVAGIVSLLSLVR